MYLLVMLQLKLARRKPYLESWLTQKSVLNNMFLPLLLKLARNMSLKKRRTLMKAFIESHFNYCPLILMFHSRIMNNKINRIHERALRLVFHDLSPSIMKLFSILRKIFYATLGHTVNFTVEMEHMVFSS